MGFIHLPVEILYEIVDYGILSSTDLKNLRLVHPFLGHVIARKLFQTINVKISDLLPSLLCPEEPVSEEVRSEPEPTPIMKRKSKKGSGKRAKHSKKSITPMPPLSSQVYKSLRFIKTIPTVLAVDFCVKAGKGSEKIPSSAIFQSLCRYMTALKTIKARIYPSGGAETSLAAEMLCGNGSQPNPALSLEVTIVPAGNGRFGWLSWDCCPGLYNLNEFRNVQVLRLPNDWLPYRNKERQRLTVREISRKSLNLRELEISENWVGSLYGLMQQQVFETDFPHLEILRLIGTPGMNISLYGAAKLRNLRELDMSESEDPAPTFWTQLSAQRIQLEMLRMKFISRECFTYIASLERLTSLDIKFNRFKTSTNVDEQHSQQGDDNQEDLGMVFWSTVIPKIQHSLVNLSVLPRRSIYYSDQFYNKSNFDALASWHVIRSDYRETSSTYQFPELKSLALILLDGDDEHYSIERLMAGCFLKAPKLATINATVIYLVEHITIREEAIARIREREEMEANSDFRRNRYVNVSLNFEAWTKGGSTSDIVRFGI